MADGDAYYDALILSRRAREYRERVIATEKNMRNRTKNAKKVQRQATKKLSSLEEEVILLRATLVATEMRMREAQMAFAEIKIQLDLVEEKSQRRKRDCDEYRLMLQFLTCDQNEIKNVK